MNDDKKLEKEDVVLLSTRDGTENKKLFTRI
jgi:hypothetical protein